MRTAPTLLLVALLASVSRVDGQQKRPKMLSCLPQHLNIEQTLVLRFGAGHPAELGVHAPDGTPFFLVYDRDKSLAVELRPIVDKDVFRRLRELRLPVATASASPWVVGREKNEQIFAKP